jgi:hypothetical protein
MKRKKLSHTNLRGGLRLYVLLQCWIQCLACFIPTISNPIKLMVDVSQLSNCPPCPLVQLFGITSLRLDQFAGLCVRCKCWCCNLCNRNILYIDMKYQVSGRGCHKIHHVANIVNKCSYYIEKWWQVKHLHMFQIMKTFKTKITYLNEIFMRPSEEVPYPRPFTSRILCQREPKQIGCGSFDQLDLQALNDCKFVCLI